jgi:tRNA pseudouridine38/39 synthase
MELHLFRDKKKVTTDFNTLMNQDSTLNEPNEHQKAMKDEVDYDQWSKEELIQKIKELSARSEGSPGTSSHQDPSEFPTPKPPTSKKLRKDQDPTPKYKRADFSRCPSRRIALKVAYFGWTYHGLAAQQEFPNTIENHLFQALEKSKLVPTRDPEIIKWSKCGRTDKGVSSFDQVFGVTVKSRGIPVDQQTPWEGINSITPTQYDQEDWTDDKEYSYVTMLNAHLPHDIRVLAWSPVSSTFDARFSCIGR